MESNLNNQDSSLSPHKKRENFFLAAQSSMNSESLNWYSMDSTSSRQSSKVKFVVGEYDDMLDESFSSLSLSLRRQSKDDSLTSQQNATSLYHDPLRPIKGELANMAESDKIISHSMPSFNIPNNINNSTKVKYLQVPGATAMANPNPLRLNVKVDSPYPTRRRCRSTNDMEDECVWFICANCSRICKFNELN